MAEEQLKTGSETIGAAGEKNRMTLFRDDRAEDFGAIMLSIIIIAIVVLLTKGQTTSAPAKAPAPPVQSSAPAPSSMQGMGGMPGPAGGR